MGEFPCQGNTKNNPAYDVMKCKVDMQRQNTDSSDNAYNCPAILSMQSVSTELPLPSVVKHNHTSLLIRIVPEEEEEEEEGEGG